MYIPKLHVWKPEGPLLDWAQEAITMLLDKELETKAIFREVILFIEFANFGGSVVDKRAAVALMEVLGERFPNPDEETQLCFQLVYVAFFKSMIACEVARKLKGRDGEYDPQALWDALHDSSVISVVPKLWATSLDACNSQIPEIEAANAALYLSEITSLTVDVYDNLVASSQNPS